MIFPGEQWRDSAIHIQVFITFKLKYIKIFKKWNDDLKQLKFFGVSQLVLVVKNTSANAGDMRAMGLIPGSGRSPGEGTGCPL